MTHRKGKGWTFKPPRPISTKRCPACKGVGRYNGHGIAAFATIFKAETVEWSNSGKHAYEAGGLVCARCLGSGLLKDALARTLSGEYEPEPEKDVPF